MRPWTSYFKDGYTASVGSSSADIVMSADKLTATRAYTNLGTGPVMAKSTLSGLRKCYVEVKPTFATAGDVVIGIANTRANTANYVGATNDSVGLRSDGAILQNGVQVGYGPNYASGDVVAIAIDGGAQTLQFRNVTADTGWFPSGQPPIPTFLLGLPPYHLAVSFTVVGDSAVANFYGPFPETGQGVVPPGYLNWNPEALFSEQPVKVLDFDAVLADGTYTSTGITDYVSIPFTYIRWGDANLDADKNLRFTDWVIQDDDDSDWPLLSITVQATSSPANNYIWGQWNYGPLFLITRFHITTTNPIYVSNIPIPPPTATAPNLGEGVSLWLWMSCDAGVAFSWTNGRVFGTENALVWEPIEYATFPPSAVGTVQPVQAPNSIVGGNWGPPIGPPL